MREDEDRPGDEVLPQYEPARKMDEPPGGDAGLGSFREALEWVFVHHGVVRFYEKVERGPSSSPSVRISVIGADPESRYVAVVGSGTDAEAVEEAFLHAAREVKESYEEGEAETEVAMRRASMRLV